MTGVKEITTKSGLKLQVDENILDDMELFEAVVAMDDGDGTQLPKVVRKVCGDQKQKVYDHCRTETGRVSISAVTGIVGEILDAVKAKN